MSLQFIMGPSGAGKSHYLYQWVTKESLEHPEKKYIVLVPEQFTMQTQKDLVMASPRQGILNVEVLSFNRLAQRVFEETGESYRTVLNDVGKNFIIRKMAGKHSGELKIIGNNLKKVGYITELKSIISEFTQYDIQPKQIDDILQATPSESELYYKLKDIQVVYESFNQYLQDKYITNEEVLDVLASVAHRSKLLKDSVIVLDGFTGFTPVQNKLLSNFMKICEHIFVTVCIDSRENAFEYIHPYQLFALSKQMVTKLKKLADEQGVDVAPSICLYEEPAYRFHENEALAFLESNIFRYSSATFDKEQEEIQLYRANSMKEEVDFVAQKIHKLIREKECHYKDIAILTSGLDDYANHIQRVFEEYQIPIFMDHKRSILLNSCVEYVRSLLAMVEKQFSYDGVFRYLRTGMSGLLQEEVDILENYVLALGIRGYNKWNEAWVRRCNGVDQDALKEINTIREKFMDSVEDITQVLKSRSKTVREVTESLHQFFLQQELQKQVQMYRKNFETAGELALAKEYDQVYKVIIELLEQFVELLGDEKISLKEYCELLDAGLEEAKIGIIPPSLDQVVVGDVERSRMKDVKVVFFIGASDKYLPSVSAKNGFLSERDRQILSTCGKELAPNQKEKIYIQKFYLYLILTKPERKLYITYSTTTSDGKSARPSYLIAEINKLFPRMKVQKMEATWEEQELTDSKAISKIIEGLRNKQHELSAEWQELYVWYKKQEAWADRLENILEAAFYQKKEHALSKETAKELYGEVLEYSVSRLEKYSSCAYSHFLRYGLGLKEREEFQFEVLDFGNVFHEAMERFSRKVENSTWTWTSIPEEEIEKFVHESMEESVVNYGNSVLYSSFRTEYMILRIEKILKRCVWALKQQLEKGEFIPQGYEVKFRNVDGLKMANMDLGSLGKLRLRGSIDRVDVHKDDENVYVKVVDYKTGNKQLEWSRLYHGLQLQLFVYLNVAMELERQKNPDKKIVPAGVLYSVVEEPFVEKKEGVDTEDLILQAMCPDGFIQNDGPVLELYDKTGGRSKVAPFSRNKDGSPSKSDKLLTAEEFTLVSNYIEKQVRKIGEGILEGNAEISPYKIGQSDNCTYCEYKDICGIREKAFGYECREIKSMKKDETLQFMAEEVDAWE